MALDGIVTRAIVHELQACRGARINKIYQPNDRDIVFHIRTQQGNAKLLLSANPTYPRVHLTQETFLNPAEAPMFCMILRKHCESGIIEDIQQVGMERIIHMTIRQRDELGDISSKNHRGADGQTQQHHSARSRKRYHTGRHQPCDARHQQLPRGHAGIFLHESAGAA